MKLLAFSDIHDNLIAARKMRAQERNEFDAIIIAGDLGSKSTSQLFDIIGTFECPIMYVYGNWDDGLLYNHSFGEHAHLLHMNVVMHGQFGFVGYSGAQANWGQNPIAIKLLDVRPVDTKLTSAALEREFLEIRKSKLILTRKHDRAIQRLNASTKNRRIDSYREWAKLLAENRAADFARLEKSERAFSAKVNEHTGVVPGDKQVKRDVLRLNRQQLLETIQKSGISPERLIVVTHERTPWDYLDGAKVHLFGHRHGYSDRPYKGTRCINVSALDDHFTVRQKGLYSWTYDDCRNVNGGSYVTIEISSSGAISSNPRLLPCEYKGWVPIKGDLIHGAPCIPEEEIFLKQ